MTKLPQSFAAAALFACAAVIGCTSKKLETDQMERVETAAKDAERAAERARRAAEEAHIAAKFAEETLVIPQAKHAAERKEIQRRNVMTARAPMAETQAHSSAPPLGIGALKLSRHADPGRFASLTVGRREELWVIVEAEEPAQPAVMPIRCGLYTKRENVTEEVALPLKHTGVNARVSGHIASVRVTQQYQNPYDEKIEAVYVFPLPPDAAVTDFIMVLGERRIRGIIREREEAEQIYHEAKHQGYVVSLLTQERPNIFTQSVANIEPAKTIDIEITYFGPLRYDSGEYEFVFPMVVGPRFNPPGSKDGVGAVAHGVYGASGQTTEIQYLRPNERSGHDIALNLDIEAGVEIEEIHSPSHAIEAEEISPSRRRVRLSPLDSIPNKDFVLRYRVAGDRVKSAFLAHRDERGGFFTLMIQPPAELASLERSPMEMVFVLDCSGSMSGKPLAIAKGAIERALRRLTPDDTFQIVRFSDDASALGPRPVPATPRNIERALDYLASLNSEGGTMMIEGIKAALDFPHDPERLRVVSFLTDGYIGNEVEVLEEMQRRLGAARVFSFGIGSSPNRYLLDRMALLGNGAVAYVGLDEGAAHAVDGFYERVSRPALTDLRIDWGNLDASEVYPQHVPDLFVGRPVVLTGRFEGKGRTAVTISGRAGGRAREITIPIDLDDPSITRPEIASIWARSKIADLEDRATIDDSPRIPAEIKETALHHGLVSAFTAFVAVDSSAPTSGDHGTSITIPVPVPAGVRYDTTVGER